MIGSKAPTGRAVPVPHPPDVLDWIRLITQVQAELELQGRALELKTGPGRGAGKSTWHRILSGHTLPPRPVFDRLASHEKFDAARRRLLLEAWAKASSCLDQIEAERKAAREPAGARRPDTDEGAGQPEPVPLESSGEAAEALAAVNAEEPAAAPALPAPAKEPATVLPRSDTSSLVLARVLAPGRFRKPNRNGRLVIGTTAAVACAVFAAYLASDVVPGHPADHGTAGSGPAAAQPAPVPTTQDSQPPGVEEGTPGIEKGTLGDDSRCSAPVKGPAAVTWRVCTRVESTRISFALKITNSGHSTAAVKTLLRYAQAGKTRACPAAAPEIRTLSAGETFTTDLARCSTGRLDTAAAYQAIGWVIAEDTAEGVPHMSPTANVYPTYVKWVPDLL